MKKIVISSICLLVFVFIFLLVRFIKVDGMVKAFAQPPPAKPSATPPPPSDMPIPPGILDATENAPPAVIPAPSEVVPPLEGQQAPPAGLPTPQEIDPSIKFLNNEGFVYDPTGRRDPFKSFMMTPKIESPLPLEQLAQPTQAPKQSIPSFLMRPSEGSNDTLEGSDAGAFKLVGILWDVHDPKAMVRSPRGKVFLVRKKTRIGNSNGYVAAIREGEIVVIEVSESE
jgi:type IV pilus assembly protein PilP